MSDTSGAGHRQTGMTNDFIPAQHPRDLNGKFAAKPHGEPDLALETPAAGSAAPALTLEQTQRVCSDPGVPRRISKDPDVWAGACHLCDTVFTASSASDAPGYNVMLDVLSEHMQSEHGAGSRTEALNLALSTDDDYLNFFTKVSRLRDQTNREELEGQLWTLDNLDFKDTIQYERLAQYIGARYPHADSVTNG